MASTRRSRLGRWLLILGRVALGLIFLFAAYGKLRPVDSAPFTLASLEITGSSLSLSTMTFAMQVDSYQLLPPWAVLFVSHTLPWFELGLAILLLAGIALRWAALLTTGLLAAYFGILTHSYMAGLEINCGCFGPGAEPLNGRRLLIEAAFLALGIGVTIGAFLQARARREARAIASAAQAASAD